MKLYTGHRGELRHPPLHLNPSCRRAQPRWKLHFSNLTHSHCFTVQTHGSKERWCQDQVLDQGGRRGGRGKERKNSEEEEDDDGRRGMKKRCYSECSDGAGREERLGNSTFHPSPATTVRANISLPVLAGSSQAVRERSGKLQRDRRTVRLSLSLIA